MRARLAVIGLCAVAALAGCTNDGKTSAQADREGRRLCGPDGIGGGSRDSNHVDAYQQTGDGMAAMQRMASRLRASDRWRKVGEDFEQMAGMGPSANWSSEDMARFQHLVDTLRADCKAV